MPKSLIHKEDRMELDFEDLMDQAYAAPRRR